MNYLYCVCNAGAWARAGVRVRAWGCARVRVRMREGGSGWTGVCWRVISEGCSWRIGVAVGIGLAGCVAAGAPKVGGQGGPEREPKASAREWANAG